MDNQQIRITVPGIKKSLRRYDKKKSIAEYIWNGYDAGASIVEIDIETNKLDGIESIKIIDNGHGIDYQRLDTTFRPFFQSEKELNDAIRRKTSAVQGKNGVGRLTFFSFARHASWTTTFSQNDTKYRYTITVDNETLNTFNSTNPIETKEETGTIVEFTGIDGLTIYDFDDEIIDYLMKRFCWFLELNKKRNFKLLFDGNELDYSTIVGERDVIPYSYQADKTVYDFDIRYVRWTERLADEYSHYYYLGSDNVERAKETTTLNNKGDNFYHSVYITSAYFDMIERLDLNVLDSDSPQLLLPNISRTDDVYRDLRDKVDQILREKRKPFLRKYTDTLISSYEEDGIFPEIKNQWDEYRNRELETLVRELYQVEPKLFNNLNTEQKKTFVHLLNLALDEGEREHLFTVLKEIINLDSSELQQLASLLKTSRLSNIIRTIRLIEDRFIAVEELKELVFNKDLRANEPEHIQKMIEKHYWLFGEKYHLVTAAEPKFEEALRRFTYILRGEKSEQNIDHKDKNREMDIFAVRTMKGSDAISNIVVELKHPRILLGEKELSQVKKYMRVVMEQPQFNASNMTWEFYLVGNRFDTSHYLEGEIENSKQHGEPSLAYAVKDKKYKIFVKKWSEIFTEFEIRHNFLLEKLNIERERLTGVIIDPDHIVAKQDYSTASGHPEFQIPEDQ